MRRPFPTLFAIGLMALTLLFSFYTEASGARRSSARKAKKTQVRSYRSPSRSPKVSPARRPSGVSLKLPLANPRIVIHKGERRLDLYSGKTKVRSYQVGLGFGPTGTRSSGGMAGRLRAPTTSAARTPQASITSPWG